MTVINCRQLSNEDFTVINYYFVSKNHSYRLRYDQIGVRSGVGYPLTSAADEDLSEVRRSRPSSKLHHTQRLPQTQRQARWRQQSHRGEHAHSMQSTLDEIH